MFGVFDIVIHIPLLVFVWIPIIIYLYTLSTNLYWKRNKIPFILAKPIIGNLLDILIFRKSVAELFDDMYNHRLGKGKPFIGINLFHKPALVIKDPELIKRILVGDFTSFADRHASSDIHSDTLGSSNLFLIPNPAWKVLRARMTPFFTSAKMKQIFYLIKNIGNELNETILSLGINEKTKSYCTEIKDLFARYTIDVIASCAFGVEANSLKNPDSEFRQKGKRIFDFNWYRGIEFFCIFFLPEIVPLCKFKAFSKDSTKFLRDTMNHVIDEREKSGSVRNDLIDTLINFKNEDKSKLEIASNLVFQGDVIVAQAGIFFAAGYETSSTAISFAVYELAFQLEMQMRLRKEIKETLEQSNGEVTYENVNDMVYVNMIVQEILRMYPPLPFLDRICTKNEGYALEPYDDFVIPKDMPILIPTFSIQRDKKYWTNPNIFDPERFSAENRDNIVPYTYLPFGIGPHNCIGERFGVLQVKIGLINIFKNHYVTPGKNTPRIPKFEPKALVIQSKDGILLNFVRDPLF